MKLCIKFLLPFILYSTTSTNTISLVSASSSSTPSTGSVVTTAPSSPVGGNGGISDNTKKNPVFQLAGYVKDSFLRMKDGSVQLYTNHQTCNEIRSKQKDHLSMLSLSLPESQRKAAKKYRVNAGGISYQEFDFLQKGKEDRSRLANIVFMMVFAPNFVPYAFMFFPEMLPSSFQMPMKAGAISKFDTLSRERTHAVLQTMIDVERSARVAPLISNINPFGKGKTKRTMEKMEKFGHACGALLAADGASGSTGAELVIKVLEDEIYTKEEPTKGRTALTIIPKPIIKGLGKALEAPSSTNAFLPAFLLRGKVLNCLTQITAADEFLVTQQVDLKTLSSDLLQDACSKRLISVGPGSTNEEMVTGLSSWLDLAVRKPSEKMSSSGSSSQLHYNGNLLRAALLSFNAVDAARDTRSSSFLPRLMYQGQLYSSASANYALKSASNTAQVSSSTTGGTSSSKEEVNLLSKGVQWLNNKK